MPIRTVKPTSPARRYLTYVTYDEITKTTPEKSLLAPKTRTNGRNNMGRITVRHRGRGHKRMLRTVDFRREKFGIPARVAAIEYDPNRSANLALLFRFEVLGAHDHVTQAQLVDDRQGAPLRARADGQHRDHRPDAKHHA